MTPRGRLRGSAAAAAVLAFAVPATLRAVTPAAYAQATGTITVDLVESVGADWFAEIGDREVVLRRVEGIDPTTAAGQAQLGELDIPALVRSGTTFPEVDRATTSGGLARFTSVEQGVYLVEVLDSAETRDARVSYSPVVVVVVDGSLARTVAPKAQVLGAASNPLTACTTPGWLDASAPGKYVEYDYAFNLPNPSTDGTISAYEVSFEFSLGHTVQWESRPVVVQAAAAGRNALAAARAGDPNARVEVRVPALTNMIGPWGTVSRGQVLGTLETTATLRTDGMDALRTPVEVFNTSHVNVISRQACVVTADGGGDGGGGDGPGGPGGSPGSTGTVGFPGSPGTDSTGGQGQPGQPGETRGGDGAGSDGQRGSGQRTGLASTGAGVLGITGIALLLVVLGLLIRRRDRKEEQHTL
ncbi:hypothetical protein G7Y29_09290 [Corynebacterium qintianiae]|uniref:Prealbumin-like fold domain-containing protein n=1 Tax=Corynebacterium qintianiae TaxID=2709392 RepID=A0A7T0PDK8_9CORY|nr:hypothetical protein [Corynebacterium qintianiae]QPK83023.1 hypothetical protein G7Y29_09290 [Corynebacterium qintianiae]